MRVFCFFFFKYKESLVAQSCPILCNPMDCSLPAPSVGFSKQENWSGLPFPSPGDLPDPGTKPTSPAWLVGSLPLSYQRISQARILGWAVISCSRELYNSERQNFYPINNFIHYRFGAKKKDFWNINLVKTIAYIEVKWLTMTCISH